jgi:hypothetical protein
MKEPNGAQDVSKTNSWTDHLVFQNTLREKPVRADTSEIAI